jgi:hypothetical protein
MLGNKMKKILVQIDTFPNTKDKIEITKLCIISLRDLGYPIIITSHIDIPEELRSMCDFSFSDNNNIILPPTGDINYFDYSNSGFSMHFKIEDMESHSPSCITSWTNGADLAIEKGFEFLLHVEYDFVLDKEEIEKLKKCMEISISPGGFIILGGEYASTRCIFMSPEKIKKSVPVKISTPDDYFNFCHSIGVPSEIRRMAGVSTYYSLKKSGILDNLVILPSDGEKFFQTSIPENLETSFPGFFAPLVRNKEEVYLCSYGMSGNNKGEYEILEKKPYALEKISSGDINFLSGFYTYRMLNLEKGKDYIIRWRHYSGEWNEIKISDKEIIEEFYGTFNLN